MIKVLSNPKFENYLKFKDIVFSEKFPWYYKATSTKNEMPGYFNLPFYSHCLLERPNEKIYKYPKPDSTFLEDAAKVIASIFDYNKIEFNSFLRIGINCIHPQGSELSSVPHVDHNFPHTNIIVYLTDAGGSTVVENEEFYPKEDDCIMFKGEHYMKTPLKDRRIILVATFI